MDPDERGRPAGETRTSTQRPATPQRSSNPRVPGSNPGRGAWKTPLRRGFLRSAAGCGLKACHNRVHRTLELRGTCVRVSIKGHSSARFRRALALRKSRPDPRRGPRAAPHGDRRCRGDLRAARGRRTRPLRPRAMSQENVEASGEPEPSAGASGGREYHERYSERGQRTRQAERGDHPAWRTCSFAAGEGGLHLGPSPPAECCGHGARKREDDAQSCVLPRWPRDDLGRNRPSAIATA